MALGLPRPRRPRPPADSAHSPGAGLAESRLLHRLCSGAERRRGGRRRRRRGGGELGLGWRVDAGAARRVRRCGGHSGRRRLLWRLAPSALFARGRRGGRHRRWCRRRHRESGRQSVWRPGVHGGRRRGAGRKRVAGAPRGLARRRKDDTRAEALPLARTAAAGSVAARAVRPPLPSPAAPRPRGPERRAPLSSRCSSRQHGDAISDGFRLALSAAGRSAPCVLLIESAEELAPAAGSEEEGGSGAAARLALLDALRAASRVQGARAARARLERTSGPRPSAPPQEEGTEAGASPRSGRRAACAHRGVCARRACAGDTAGSNRLPLRAALLRGLSRVCRRCVRAAPCSSP